MSSKRYKKLPEKTITLNPETIEKILLNIKKNCTTKFDESVDLSFQINNKQKKNEINIRTVVSLPGGTGKKIKVAVVCEESKVSEAKEAGADIVGGDDFVEKIKNGNMNFEKLICTPAMMIKLSKLGKILGPKGLMPNPKMGTVTPNVGEAVKLAKSGQVQFKTEKNGIVQAGIAKSNFDAKNIVENIKSFVDTIKKSKPSGAKGTFIKKISLSSTMGVSINCEIN